MRSHLSLPASLRLSGSLARICAVSNRTRRALHHDEYCFYFANEPRIIACAGQFEQLEIRDRLRSDVHSTDERVRCACESMRRQRVDTDCARIPQSNGNPNKHFGERELCDICSSEAFHIDLLLVDATAARCLFNFTQCFCIVRSLFGVCLIQYARSAIV